METGYTDNVGTPICYGDKVRGTVWKMQIVGEVGMHWEGIRWHPVIYTAFGHIEFGSFEKIEVIK